MERLDILTEQGGKMLFKRIKALIPEEIKRKIQLITVSSHDPKWEKYAAIDRKRIFIFLAGFYQNLGDMAITYAQVAFLKNEFTDAEIICVPSAQTYSSIKTIKKFIRDNDLITIAGGGNMDDNYPSLENARLHVIKSFPNNRIISFPQTIVFSESKIGKRRVKKSRKIYQKHPLFTVFAREPASLMRCKRLFPGVGVQLVPDIVLSLSASNFTKIERDKVMICCRDDKERNNEKVFRDSLLLKLQERFTEIIIKDTIDVSLEECTQERYEDTLNAFWNYIKSCRVVVTDRLHCMLFCVITKTPCVAFDNTNHKISGTYNAWLKDIPYIRLIEEQNMLDTLVAIDSIIDQDYTYYELNFSKEFELLRRILHE